MGSYETSFEMQIRIHFHVPDKVKQLFIDSDWKNHFWTFDDLQELAEHISRQIHYETEILIKTGDDRKWAKDLEGFGQFIRDQGTYTLVCSDSGIPLISAKYETELEPTWTYSI